MKSIQSIQRHVGNRNSAALAAMAAPQQNPICFEPDANVRQLFNSLFRQLRVIFPAVNAHIKTQAELDELRQQWTRAFAENGINTPVLIQVGLQRARLSETPFLPSPGQFIAWCREGGSQLAGLPDVDAVMAEFQRYSAQRGFYATPECFPWSAPIMFWLVTDMRRAMLQYNHTTDELRKVAERLLKKWEKKVMTGQPIPAPKTQLADLRRPPTIGAELGIATAETDVRGQEFLNAIRARHPRRNTTTNED
ncbi:DNA replication protein [Dickeya sp. CFBP 2040]|uniref:replication protein P n=1 Tax=Dickeya sp. CFBP 2040 TaxID=2718531 RepID=UPI001445107B|nr:replication protein P [Dickeya sp. CFBP 2040]NKI74183.1 DNA replication protein [Dickeya sp. CFBP 2040]